MSVEHDPPRLSQASDAELGELLPGLARAREQGPSADQLVRICAGVAARAVPADGSERSGEPEPRGGATGTSASSTGLLKLAKLIAAGALLGAAAFYGGRQLQQTRAATASAPAPSPRAATGAAVPRQPERLLAGSEQRDAKPLAGEVAPDSMTSRPTAARQRPKPSAESDDPNAELALLKRARAEVRSAPDRALALTMEHAARFAHGLLAEEREVIAIEALLVLDRSALAQQRARAFFAAYPRSAHSRRVHTLLAGHDAALLEESPSASPHPLR